MISVSHRPVAALAMSLLLVVSPLVEAKRVGGGRSSGMSRSATTYNRTPPPSRPVAPSRPVVAGTPTTAAPASSGRSFGPGALAAGVAAGAVAGYAMGAGNQPGSNNGYNNGAYPADQANQGNWNAQAPVQQRSNFSWFWLLLLGGIGYMLYRRFKNRQTPALATAGGVPLTKSALPTATGSTGVPLTGAPLTGDYGAYTGGAQFLSDGTGQAAFLRQARALFTQVQAMNNGRQVNELQRYFTPQLFEQIRQDLAGNTEVAEFEFANLTANLLDSSQDATQHIASVRFTGTVSEHLNDPMQPFAEVWHFVKPLQGGDWLVAGIQQEG